MRLSLVDTAGDALCTVEVDGVVVGEVAHRLIGPEHERRWIASLQLGHTSDLPQGLGRVTGTADSAEQAVKNAIHAYREHFRRALLLLDDLDIRLRGVPL